ncbi:MAG: 50S ribosomal protein L9 [Pseudomonadota bacterium]
MEIILLENIDNLGMVGQQLKVKNGYARNYLLPRKLACLATQENLNYYRTLIEAKQKKLAKAKAAADEQANQLAGVTLTFIRKSRDQDSRLFGSVTNADVAEALLAKGYEIDKRRVALSEPIKKLGDYKAMVRLHPQVVAEVPVVVEAEQESKDGV